MYDALGQPLSVVDPRGIEAFRYRYDLLGRVTHEVSVDAGPHWTLTDDRGLLVHRWNGRDVHTIGAFDLLARPQTVTVDWQGAQRVVERYWPDPNFLAQLV